MDRFAGRQSHILAVAIDLFDALRRTQLDPAALEEIGRTQVSSIVNGFRRRARVSYTETCFVLVCGESLPLPSLTLLTQGACGYVPLAHSAVDMPASGGAILGSAKL